MYGEGVWGRGHRGGSPSSSHWLGLRCRSQSYPDYFVLRRRPRGAKAEAVWPRGREPRLRPQSRVLGHEEGEGGQERRSPHFTHLLRVCLGLTSGDW